MRQTEPFRDVPSKAYPLGVHLVSEGAYSFQIATAEKALCDQLYKTKPVANYEELHELLRTYKDFMISLTNRNFNTIIIIKL